VIDSLDRFLRSATLTSFATLWLATTGCSTTPAPLTEDNILTPLPARSALQPSDGDLATRDLVRAALITSPAEMDQSLDSLLKIAKRGGEANRKIDRRIPMSIDLINSTMDDPVEYRAACKKLLKRRKLDPRLKERLKECAADDLLRLARRRVWDTRESFWAETYNAVAEPLSRSLLSGGVLAPYYIATSTAEYLARLNERDAFPVQLRQALVLRERFLARFPDSEEVPEIRKTVERTNAKYARYQAKKLVFQAKIASKNNQHRVALYLAELAVERDPKNRKATAIVTKSVEAIAQQTEGRARSNGSVLDVSPKALALDTSRASSLLLPGSDLAVLGRTLSSAPPTRGDGEYVLATALDESGRESLGWERLRNLSMADPATNTMSRHAAALIRDPNQNPYGHFQWVKTHQKNLMIRWRIFGPFFQGPRYRRLPPVLAWLMDLPAIVNTAVFSPVRLIVSPLGQAPNFKAPVASAGYRYLDLHPDGEHMKELADWLYGYESKQKNWSAALRLADYLPSIDSESREELVEKVVLQRINAAYRHDRRDIKNSILRDTARDYPDSEGGHLAGVAAREELENVSAQNIRVTRGFLIENPQVAGPRALGVRPELIDGENRNGELHPRGVTFLGARYLEFEFLAESGEEDEPSIKLRRKISEERLSNAVAALDDTVHRNMRVDPDMDAGSDSRRDLFLERARLGLTEEPDMRATAQSTYVYESARERYGMVRGRESILPFDLVVRGDFQSLGLAAFPRWRKPRETPDAFLYR
jgi:hypothetical protein